MPEKVPIKVVSANLFSLIKLDSKNSDCPICKKDLFDVTEEEIEKGELEEVYRLRKGKCGHTFHINCFEKWSDIENNDDDSDSEEEEKKPVQCPLDKGIFQKDCDIVTNNLVSVNGIRQSN